MKEKRVPTPFAEALESFVKRSGFATRLRQASIIEEWPALVGPQIAAVTQPESVTADGMLRVRVATAPWANELSLMTPRIMAKLNANRSGLFKGIRWIAGPLDR